MCEYPTCWFVSFVVRSECEMGRMCGHLDVLAYSCMIACVDVTLKGGSQYAINS